VTLCNAFANPNNISALLFLQLQEGVEDSEVELLHECIHIQTNLVFKELVLQSFLPWVGPCTFEALLVLTVIFGNLSNLIIVISSCKSLESIWCEPATGWVQFLPVILGKLGSKGVDSDDECTPIRLETKNLTHHVRGLAADVATEVVEGFQVGFVEGITDYLYVHFVEILFVDARLEERGEGSVDKHRIIKFCWSAGDMNSFHLLETTQRMALADKLRNGPLMKSACDEEDNIVNHVAIGDIVQECCQVSSGVVPHVLKFYDKLLSQLLVNNGYLKSALIGKKVSIICGLKVELEIIKSLALNQVQVVVLGKNTILESSAETF